MLIQVIYKTVSHVVLCHVMSTGAMYGKKKLVVTKTQQ